MWGVVQCQRCLFKSKSWDTVNCLLQWQEKVDSSTHHPIFHLIHIFNTRRCTTLSLFKANTHFLWLLISDTKVSTTTTLLLQLEPGLTAASSFPAVRLHHPFFILPYQTSSTTMAFISLAFKMAIMILLGLLMEACYADVSEAPSKQVYKQTTTNTNLESSTKPVEQYY